MTKFKHYSGARISRNSGLLTVTLTHTAQGKWGYEKTGQEWTDGHDAEEHLSPPNTGHKRSWAVGLKQGCRGMSKELQPTWQQRCSLSPWMRLCHLATGFKRHRLRRMSSQKQGPRQRVADNLWCHYGDRLTIITIHPPGTALSTPDMSAHSIPIISWLRSMLPTSTLYKKK